MMILAVFVAYISFCRCRLTVMTEYFYLYVLWSVTRLFHCFSD